jgi:thiamine pyrophosphate-dependent acetolactate synthase large subunit-like protein/nitrite reductase/ring-hydroxylating ferredoxin subunit
MTEAKIANNEPIAVELKAGKTYAWCACGRSSNQPFCDGSHAGTDHTPVRYQPEKDGTYHLCRCKQTGRPPHCDGSHLRLAGEEASHGATEATEDETMNGPVVQRWHRVAAPGDMGEGEVRAVQAGSKTIALTFFEGRYGALDNACPHQGGPLGEGSIENCWLRCPWHGWDFHPLTGKSPGEFDDGVDTHPVEERDDGIYVQVEERVRRTRTVSDQMVETMVNWGLTHVFGMVGHSNLGLADAVREQEESGRLTYIGVRHEGAAAFACSGFAKLTGRPAACLSIAGPGATNLLTGLWDAKVDRAPVLALTGQVNTQVFGPGAFQEIDLASAFEAVASFSQTVLPNSKHAELVNLALKHALVERDVAHLIFPDEVQNLPAEEGGAPSGSAGRLAEPHIRPSKRSLKSAVKLLKRASRPVIVVGYGARAAMPWVVALAERLHAPVLTTFKAKGQIPDHHPLAAGVLGRSGTPVASWFMNESDLMLVFGASFSNHTGIDPKKVIIQVDFDRMALGKFHPVELPLWGEIGITARLLLNRLGERANAADPRRELANRRAMWREEKARRSARDRGRGLSSASVFGALSRLVAEDAVVAVDVGNNTYSFGRYFECRHQSVLMSGYLGSIGFSFPASMGAWAATQAVEEQRGRQVVSVSGDGGFGQYLAEFSTAAKYGMNITHVLLNNGELGKISKEQRSGNWKVWQTSLQNPDFAAFARSCGGHGARVERADELDEAIRNALDHDGPALVDIRTDPELI